MLFVTRPISPDPDSLNGYLRICLEQRRFTNGGPLEALLELRLRELIGARHLSLVNNGTMALTLALNALAIRGEVITTPFTFCASTHAIAHAGAQEVFVDVDPDTLTIDPEQIEAAITPETEAILGVHVYGVPCAVNDIAAIAKRRGLAVIYDGAHAFNTTYGGTPIGRFGDATTYSFHATKLFHTAEGGAVESVSAEVSGRIRLLRNFGIESEDVITACGTNGKMSEITAAMGLAVLERLGAEYMARVRLRALYAEALRAFSQVRIVKVPAKADSGMYFAIRLPAAKRDEVQAQLRHVGVMARRYFYPLSSESEFFQNRHDPHATPIALAASREVLCLPFHSGVTESGVAQISETIGKTLE